MGIQIHLRRTLLNWRNEIENVTHVHELYIALKGIEGGQINMNVCNI